MINETKQKEIQDFLKPDYLIDAIENFLVSVQNKTPIFMDADRIILVANWSKFPKGKNPFAKFMEDIALLSFEASSWMKVSSLRIIELKEFKGLLQSFLSRIPEKLQSRQSEYINRMEQYDYVFFTEEAENILVDDLQSAYETADLLEKAMNIAKVKESDPLEFRKIEDFQWNLIETKKMLLELQSCPPEEEFKQKKEKLEEIVRDLQSKLSACEKVKMRLKELGLEETIKKDLLIEKLQNGRVRLVWRKSG